MNVVLKNKIELGRSSEKARTISIDQRSGKTTKSVGKPARSKPMIRYYPIARECDYHNRKHECPFSDHRRCKVGRRVGSWCKHELFEPRVASCHTIVNYCLQGSSKKHKTNVGRLMVECFQPLNDETDAIKEVSLEQWLNICRASNMVIVNAHIKSYPPAKPEYCYESPDFPGEGRITVGNATMIRHARHWTVREIQDEMYFSSQSDEEQDSESEDDPVIYRDDMAPPEDVFKRLDHFGLEWVHSDHFVRQPRVDCLVYRYAMDLELCRTIWETDKEKMIKHGGHELTANLMVHPLDLEKMNLNKHIFRVIRSNWIYTNKLEVWREATSSFSIEDDIQVYRDAHELMFMLSKEGQTLQTVEEHIDSIHPNDEAFPALRTVFETPFWHLLNFEPSGMIAHDRNNIMTTYYGVPSDIKAQSSNKPDVTNNVNIVEVTHPPIVMQLPLYQQEMVVPASQITTSCEAEFVVKECKEHTPFDVLREHNADVTNKMYDTAAHKLSLGYLNTKIESATAYYHNNAALTNGYYEKPLTTPPPALDEVAQQVEYCVNSIVTSDFATGIQENVTALKNNVLDFVPIAASAVQELQAATSSLTEHIEGDLLVEQTPEVTLGPIGPVLDNYVPPPNTVTSHIRKNIRRPLKQGFICTCDRIPYNFWRDFQKYGYYILALLWAIGLAIAFMWLTAPELVIQYTPYTTNETFVVFNVTHNVVRQSRQELWQPVEHLTTKLIGIFVLYSLLVVWAFKTWWKFPHDIKCPVCLMQVCTSQPHVDADLFAYLIMVSLGQDKTQNLLFDLKQKALTWLSKEANNRSRLTTGDTYLVVECTLQQVFNFSQSEAVFYNTLGYSGWAFAECKSQKNQALPLK